MKDRTCGMDEKNNRVSTVDFSYFCSIISPESGIEKLRTLCDWGNWVGNFPQRFFIDAC
jgi:hypothetical protein